MHLFLSFVSMFDPYPLTRAWSSQSSYCLVLSIFFMCFLCTLVALDPCCMHFMHTKYCQSLLCTFCVHLMLSILFVHFPCARSAFDPLHTCLVFLIIFACFLPHMVLLIFFAHVWSFVSYMFLVVYHLSFNTSSLDPFCVHLVLRFIF